MNSINSLPCFETDINLWEYFLVAQPDEEVNEMVLVEKDFLHAIPGYETGLITKPHITVANFQIKEIMEETLIRWMQNIFNLHASFSVTLNNFSSFPPHTIYLRVQDPKPLKKLANALKILDGFIQSNDCPPLYLVAKPHLAIESGLPEYIYEKAIKEYAQRSFHASFKVDKLFLLKRDASMKCYLINTFILPAPLPLFD
jgi:2'-5' RNA ligase